jgi:hypothetical protein
LRDVAHMPALQQLTIRNMALTDDALVCLEQACSALHTLRALELIEYHQWDSAADEMLHALPSPALLSSLTLALFVDTESAADLFSSLSRCSGLRQLTLCLFDEPDSPAQWLELPSVLQQLTSLEALVIQGAKAGNASVRALAEVLPQLVQLTKLQLLGTWCEEVEEPTHIQGICRCVLVPCSAELLAKALGALPMLATLILSDNFLGDGGLQVLAPTLAQLTHLTVLALAGNKLSNAAAPLIAQVACGLSRMESLMLSDNNVSSDVERLLEQRLRCMPNVRYVFFA